MRLSKNFTLEEFLISQTATRHGIDMTPAPHIVKNLQVLVDNCMQPLRTELGTPISISSGYRPRALNLMIGGSATSAHVDGRACDFRAHGFSPLYVCQAIRELALPYDQNIHEFGQWTHLGISEVGRSQDLTAYRKDGAVAYVTGLHAIEELT